MCQVRSVFGSEVSIVGALLSNLAPVTATSCRTHILDRDTYVPSQKNHP